MAIWLCVVLLCAAGCRAQSQQLSFSKYQVLRTRVLAGDLTVNWGELRTVAAAAGVESGYDWHSARKRVLADVEAGRLAAALSGANSVIDRNIADPEGHLLAMTVYQRLDREDDADREQRIVDAPVASIMNSGTGESAQKAWATVSTAEEEFVVNMVLDAELRSQVPVQRDGHAYDKATVLGEDGAEHVLWFVSDASAVGAGNVTQSKARVVVSALR